MAVVVGWWQRQFFAFYLPNPFRRNQTRAGCCEAVVPTTFSGCVPTGRACAPESVVAELLRVLPRAEHLPREGFELRQAWAKASLQYPELPRARSGITLLLGMMHTRGTLSD